MKALIKRHYEAVKQRGLIDDYVTLEAFRNKLREEIQEFWDADVYE